MVEFFRFEVGDRCTLEDRPERRDGAACVQKCFGQGGFTCAEVGYQRDISTGSMRISSIANPPYLMIHQSSEHYLPHFLRIAVPAGFVLYPIVSDRAL